MKLVEQHIIERDDPSYAVIDAAALASKNLYNAALYVLRQTYIFEGKYLSYTQMDKRMQPHEAYKALPAKVSQQVLVQLDKNWQSFFEARERYAENPSKFTGRPGLPKYKHKTEGRNLLVYTEQAVSKRGLKQGLVQPSKLPISVKTKQQTVDQVRIVPRKGYYVVEVVYTKESVHAEVDSTLCAGIDLGVNTLAAIASNKPGFVPRIVSGAQIKSWNQWYNKRRAELQHKLGKPGTSRQLERLTKTRNRRIQHALHMASRQMIALLVKERIGTLIIGKNEGWKQEVSMGSPNNQNFVQIPHSRFIQMLSYKAALVGIAVIITEESYTSQASFLDLDPLPVYNPEQKQKPTFSGKRMTRGLYQAKDGRTIQADVNGAYNILRKGRPDAFSGAKGVADGRVATPVVVHPVRIILTKPKASVS
jgi:putative transposase